MGYLRDKKAAWIRWYYISRILQIWSTTDGYEELARGFEPIRNGAIF